MKTKTTPDPRGPLLITASFSALLAIWLWHDSEADKRAQRPAAIETAAAEVQSCPGQDAADATGGCMPSDAATAMVTRSDSGSISLLTAND